MKIAVVGCAHGELDKIYESIRHLEETEQIRVDFVICCGDFQAVRNYDDLSCMAVPQNYLKLETFYKYYSGESVAPYLTLFIGGNHEASNYLAELPYGGWVAPGIYYFGLANVLRIGDLRIGGISGIFKGHDYFKGHFECPPYNEGTKRSSYHVRQQETFRLKQLKPNQLDIFISHDWPRNIHQYGNEKRLFKAKAFFEDEAMRGQLGSPPLEELLYALKPKFWFAAHMHVKFPALVSHDDGSETRFLALDKCLPNRNYLQIMDLGESKPEGLALADFKYDPEWLAILKSTNHLASTSNRAHYMPGPGSDIRFQFTPTDEEINQVESIFANDFVIPNDFKWTGRPLWEEEAAVKPWGGRWQRFYINPHTTEFCKKLGITNTNELLARLRPSALEEPYYLQQEDHFAGPSIDPKSEVAASNTAQEIENPDEIQLDEDTLSEDGEKPFPEIEPMKRQFEEQKNEQGNFESKDDDKSETKKFKRRNADLYTSNDNESQ